MSRVLVCVQQPLMQEGLAAVLDREPAVTVVARAGDVATAIGVVVRQPVDVVVISHDPPVLDGIDLARKLPPRDGSRLMAVLLLVSALAEEEVLEALRVGVRGVLPKEVATQSLATAVHDIHLGAMVLATPTAIRLVGRLVRGMPSTFGYRPQSLTELTSRELDVLVLVARGHSNQGIATQLSVSEATVKSHLYHLCRKLNLRDRTHAAILAYETGLIRPSPLAEPSG